MFLLLIVFLFPAGSLCAADTQNIVAMPIATFAERQAKVKAAKNILQDGDADKAVLQPIIDAYSLVEDLDRKIHADLIDSAMNSAKEIRAVGYRNSLQKIATNNLFYEAIKADIHRLLSRLKQSTNSIASIVAAENRVINIFQQYAGKSLTEADNNFIRSFAKDIAQGFDIAKDKRERKTSLVTFIAKVQNSSSDLIKNSNKNLKESLLSFLQTELDTVERLPDNKVLDPKTTFIDLGITQDPEVFKRKQQIIEGVYKTSDSAATVSVKTGGSSDAFKQAQVLLAAERGATIVRRNAARALEPLQALLLLNKALQNIANDE